MLRTAQDYAAALRPRYEARAADVVHDSPDCPDEALFDLVTDIMRDAEVPFTMRPEVRVELMSERRVGGVASMKLADLLGRGRRSASRAI